MAATASEEAVMAEELLPIAQNLRGIKNKLKCMKEDGKFTFEEIHHYQKMLDAIDSKRQDGVFGGSPPEKIPVGQATCVEILEESYGEALNLMHANIDHLDRSCKFSMPSQNNNNIAIVDVVEPLLVHPFVLRFPYLQI